jgi:7-cyano-7-deazaguanine synthase
MTKKAFVLLSGGLDSTTCLYKAIYEYWPEPFVSLIGRANLRDALELRDPSRWPDQESIDWVEAVSIDYGQRHKKEMEYAKATCDKLGIQHFTIPLGDALKSANTMLTEGNIAIPNASYADLPHGVSPTYVPYRNGTMLSLLTAHAQKWITAQNKEHHSRYFSTDETSTREQIDKAKPSAGIYFGAHSEDAQNWAYPDCTPEFIGAMANAIHVGTYYQVRLHTPLQWLMKSEIVELGQKLGVPFEDTWSCYAGNMYHCGTCPTCRSRKDAFTKAGIYDPTIYQDQQDTASKEYERRIAAGEIDPDEIPF